MPGFNGINDSVYLVSDADFISLSKQIGDTHPTAKGMERLEYYYDGKSDEPIILSNSVYTLIHSKSPEKTEAWINENFPDLTLSVNNRSPLITPGDVYNELIQSKSNKIVTNLIAMIAIIAVTSVCMYFIMHASIMNRIKEIGIYRAIGVSRKNLIFKFFIEAALLATLTVFVGYLVSSGLLFVFLRGSSLISEILYYPVWLALSVLGIVYSITLFFGTLPIILMLRKTPSQILAKYDI
jgi:ABC-type antimicrobial peptide transport system permease subunit